MGISYRERFRKEKTFQNREEFIRSFYITCNHCGYNNEKRRLRKYGVCLKCGEPLDDKIFFMIKMQELMEENKRKAR